MTQLCKHCRRTVMFLSRLYLWLFKRIIKITLFEVLWFLLLVFAVVIWCSRKDDNANISNPVVLWWTEGFPGTSDTINCDNVLCDVYSNRNVSKLEQVRAYLFYGSNINFDDLPLPRNPDEIIWGLYHEESPRNVEELMHEATLKLFNFSATYSRHSDVPFPLQHLESFDDITSTKYYVRTSEKNKFLKDIAPVLYLQSDCETSTERDLYVRELMNFIAVDSYGACLNNKELTEEFTNDYLNNLNEDNFLKFVAKYKFVIAIENGVCEDYVTEKFWRAIKVGSVPIYFGSPSINLWLPNPRSALLLKDFPSPKLLSEHIKNLLQNDEQYEKYLEHKTKRIVTNKRLIQEFNNRSYQLDSLKVIKNFECYICKKIHDTLNGAIEISVVNKSHYDCPKPLSALELKVNPKNTWVHSWEYKRRKSEEIYKRIMKL